MNTLTFLKDGTIILTHDGTLPADYVRMAREHLERYRDGKKSFLILDGVDRVVHQQPDGSFSSDE